MKQDATKILQLINQFRDDLAYGVFDRDNLRAFANELFGIEESPVVKFRHDPLLWPENPPTPAYAKPGDSGVDLVAAEDVIIGPGETRRVRTGLYIELPEGFEAQVRPRSGLAAKHGMTVLNSPGTVDTGYRGSVDVLLHRTAPGSFTVKKGDRIAQMVVAPVFQARFERVDELSDSERGDAGFGSTGVTS